MDFDYEQFFIQHFIVKNKRERLQFELLNESRRQNAISRFDHNAMKYIDERKLIYSGNDISWSDLKKLICENTDGVSFDTMYQMADSAMYLCKNNQGNMFKFYRK